MIWDGMEPKKNGFSRLLLQAPKNMFSQGSHFVKRFTKTASAPPVELFVELKQKNDFTSEVKPCQTGPYSFLVTRQCRQCARALLLDN